MNWLLSQVALAVDGRLVGVDVALTGVSTDTRAIAAGQLFIALRGERFDAHDFLAQAAENGATKDAECSWGFHVVLLSLFVITCCELVGDTCNKNGLSGDLLRMMGVVILYSFQFKVIACCFDEFVRSYLTLALKLRVPPVPAGTCLIVQRIWVYSSGRAVYLWTVPLGCLIS